MGARDIACGEARIGHISWHGPNVFWRAIHPILRDIALRSHPTAWVVLSWGVGGSVASLAVIEALPAMSLAASTRWRKETAALVAGAGWFGHGRNSFVTGGESSDGQRDRRRDRG